MSQIVLKTGRIILGITLLLWLAKQINYLEFCNRLAHIDISHFAVGLLFFAIVLIFEVLKLFVLLYPKVGLKSTIRAIYIGSCLNNFLPSNIGGDAYKILALSKDGGDWVKWSSLVIADRAIGLAFLIISSIVLLFLCHQTIWQPLWIFLGPKFRLSINNILLTTGGLSLLILIGYWCRKYFLGFFAALINGWRDVKPWQYFMAFLSAAIFHLSRLGGIYFFLQSLGSPIAPVQILVTMTLVAIASILPLSIGAIGIREGAFAIGLGIYGVDFTTAVTTAMLVRLILWGQAVIGGIIMVSANDKRDNA